MQGAQVIPLYRQDASHPQAQVCAQCEVRRSALFGAVYTVRSGVVCFERGPNAATAASCGWPVQAT